MEKLRNYFIVRTNFCNLSGIRTIVTVTLPTRFHVAFTCNAPNMVLRMRQFVRRLAQKTLGLGCLGLYSAVPFAK